MNPFLLSCMTAVTLWFIAKVAAPKDKIVRARLNGLKQREQAEADGHLPKDSLSKRRLTNFGARLPGNRPDIAKVLATAGSDGSPDAFIASRWLLALIGFIVGLGAGTFALVAAPMLAAAGFKAPVLLLGVRAKTRKEDIRAALPDAVDLMAVCASAGLNTSLSLKRVAARTAGVLGDELRRTVSQIDLGVPRSEALSELASRVEIDEVDALTRTLISSERFGTQIAVALNNFANDVRGARRRRAEEDARRAPVKILFPLVFLILPAFVMLTVVPLLLGTFKSLGF